MRVGRDLARIGYVTNSNANELDPEAAQRFQVAARAAARIAVQCRAHSQRVNSRLSDWINGVSESADTPCGRDKANAFAGRHDSNFGQRARHLEAQCNAMSSHLEGAEALLNHNPFLQLPALPVVRSVAEVAASCAWELDDNVSSDQRAARSYAMAFRSVEKIISQLGESTDQGRRFSAHRETLVEHLEGQGYGVIRREKDGVRKPEVAQVRVGNEYARTSFQISQRIAEQIPAVAVHYAGMSAIVHGEPEFLQMTWQTPDTLARLLAIVMLKSTEAWSDAIHAWLGNTKPAPFINPSDYNAVFHSMPPDVARSND